MALMMKQHESSNIFQNNNKLSGILQNKSTLTQTDLEKKLTLMMKQNEKK